MLLRQLKKSGGRTALGFGATLADPEIAEKGFTQCPMPHLSALCEGI